MAEDPPAPAVSAEARRLIDKRRRAQPMTELARKAKKASRKAIWTVEDIDYATVRGKELSMQFAGNDVALAAQEKPNAR